jgi:uncharacterized protein YggE
MSVRLILVLLAANLLAAPAGAQVPSPPKGTVSGVGFADLKKTPEVLRVQVEILAKGKDLKEALAKLKERREAVKTRLASLKAAKDTVVFGEPSLGGEKTDQQRQLQIMVAQRLRSGGAAPAAKNKGEPPAEVSVWLRFEVSMEAADPEALLLAGHQLQEKIRAADLSGLKEFHKLSLKEEESAEEAQLAQAMGEQGAPKRGEPTFTFVSRISEADQARALAEAFQHARKEAANLARAAGAELGPLYHLESQNAAAANTQEWTYYMNQQRYQTAVPQGLPAITATEAVGSQAGQVGYRVAVTASFLIKNP